MGILRKDAAFCAKMRHFESEFTRNVSRRIHWSAVIISENTTFGGLLRTLRTGKRLTMEQAAQQAGIHRATLDRWEKGRAQPYLPELNALLVALDASEPQKRKALDLMDAPRAARQIRHEVTQIAEQSGVGSLPHGGDLLRAMRMRRGLSLEETATRIQISGGTLRRWEKMEVWPSLGQLHRLCYALKAHEAEVVALTCGPFTRSSPLPSTGSLTAKGLMERIERCSRALYEPPFGLKDLELLTLQVDAWALAARGEAGHAILFHVYALNTCFLSYRDRHHETAAAAERYFDSVPRSSLERRGPTVWLSLRLMLIMSRLATGSQAAPRRLEELRRTLSLARNTVNESNALMRVSEALLQQGLRAEALRAAAEACQAAQCTLSEEKAVWVRGEMGIQLIRSERYAEGFSLLSNGGQRDWYRLVETSLWRAVALAGLGEKTEAQRWLTQAQADLTRYEIVPLQPRLNALQARLREEPALPTPGLQALPD